MSFIQAYSDVVYRSIALFWKSAWAFVLGYFISAGIQTFVPKEWLMRHMRKGDAKSIGIATASGAVSSSCSFAALSAARSLVQKGAHFVAAVAFMFASTNLVIELGILILIFLGWQYLAAQIAGGLVLIAISSMLIGLSYPKGWIRAARKRLERLEPEERFEWKSRFFSAKGWRMTGSRFVSEWKMAWEEVTIGFTIAGMVSVLVPGGFWSALFLIGSGVPSELLAIENALVAPLVAAATFIGSMGNIPLATIFVENGVLFAGVMAFIYSDLIVPPLVLMNAKYYGWKVALYIAGIMYASMVVTGLFMHYGFGILGLIPESTRRIAEVANVGFDYTFLLNMLFSVLAAWLVLMHMKNKNREGHGRTVGHQWRKRKGKLNFKRAAAYLAIMVNVGGVISMIAIGI